MTRENVLHTLTALRSLFVEDVRKLFKFASTWVFVIIGASPDAYNDFVATGLNAFIPPKFASIIHVLAIAGVAARAIRQSRAKTP